MKPTAPEPPPPHTNQAGVGPDHPQMNTATGYSTIYMTEQKRPSEIHSTHLLSTTSIYRFKLSYRRNKTAFKASGVVVKTLVLCFKSCRLSPKLTKMGMNQEQCDRWKGVNIYQFEYNQVEKN
jgi:hypothetical protein